MATVWSLFHNNHLMPQIGKISPAHYKTYPQYIQTFSSATEHFQVRFTCQHCRTLWQCLVMEIIVQYCQEITSNTESRQHTSTLDMPPLCVCRFMFWRPRSRFLFIGCWKVSCYISYLQNVGVRITTVSRIIC